MGQGRNGTILVVIRIAFYTLELEMSRGREFPRVPWDSHGKGVVKALFMGMGMIEWEWENGMVY